MTKEDFIGELFEYDGDYTRKFVADLAEKFFESNVCIPKGENRHPYADVLHEWIEGAEMQSGSSDSDFIDYGISCIDSFQFKYRIKPSEPVYEWQWALVLNTIGEIGRTPFMTQQEFDKNVPPEQGIYWTLDIKTKRKRQ